MKLSDVIILILVLILSYFLFNDFICRKPAAKVRIDTVNVFYPVHDSIPVKPKIIYRREKANIDSLWQEALNYAYNYYESLYRDSMSQNKENFSAAAIMDKLGNFSFRSDSLIDNSAVKGLLSFCSPIPIHPKAYFIFDGVAKDWTFRTTNELPEIRKLSDNFGFSISFSLGYGIIHKKFDFFIGSGYSYKF